MQAKFPGPRQISQLLLKFVLWEDEIAKVCSLLGWQYAKCIDHFSSDFHVRLAAWLAKCNMFLTVPSFFIDPLTIDSKWNAPSRYCRNLSDQASKSWSQLTNSSFFTISLFFFFFQANRLKGELTSSAQACYALAATPNSEVTNEW